MISLVYSVVLFWPKGVDRTERKVSFWEWDVVEGEAICQDQMDEMNEMSEGGSVL